MGEWVTGVKEGAMMYPIRMRTMYCHSACTTTCQGDWLPGAVSDREGGVPPSYQPPASKRVTDKAGVVRQSPSAT